MCDFVKMTGKERSCFEIAVFEAVSEAVAFALSDDCPWWESTPGLTGQEQCSPCNKEKSCMAPIPQETVPETWGHRTRKMRLWSACGTPH